MTDQRRMKPALDADEADALQAIGWQPDADGSVCPDSSLLLAAEDGVLDDAVAERVRKHVASCAMCQLLVKDLASVLVEEPTEAEGARIAARIARDRKPTRGSMGVWLGFGGLALAAGLAYVFVMPPPASPPAPDAQLAKSTPAPIPSVFIVSRPTIPPGDVELAVRGESTTRIGLPEQIGKALDTADKGDLPAAVSQLEGIVRTNPRSRSAGLALGAVQLRADRNGDAVTTLERARLLRSEAESSDEIDWFLSMALVRTGNRDRARALLDGVCKSGGARSASACAGVAEIDRTLR